jgi:UTP--glucose-1-phosphate uridylyltransferase
MDSLHWGPVRKAVFPVAGLGTRFLPATKVVPKEMLPVVDKPLIQYAVEEAIAAGIEHIVFVTHRSKRAIEEHLEVPHELAMLLEMQGKHALLHELRNLVPPGFSVSYVRQAEPLGLGHAVLCARALIGAEPFAVVLPDDLMDARTPVLAQMIERYRKAGGSVLAVEQIAPQDTVRYGVVDARPCAPQLERVQRIVEKPAPDQAPSLCGVVGRYLLSPAIFDALAVTEAGAGGEIQLTDAIGRLLAREPVYAFRFEGRRYDCGSKLVFLEATVNLALKHREVGEPFRALLHQLNAERPKTELASGPSTTRQPTLPASPHPV